MKLIKNWKPIYWTANQEHEKQVLKKFPDISNNQIVIAATDGFWDCWTHLEVLEFLKKGQFESLEGEHIKKSDFYTFDTDIENQFRNLIEIENFGDKL